MADTGWVGAGLAINQSDDASPYWSSPANVQGAPNGTLANDIQGASPLAIDDYRVKLIDPSTNLETGTDHAGATPWNTTASNLTMQYGSPTDLWGLALTPAIVNNPNFGVGWRYTGRTQSMIRGLQYGFAIPSGATILGVEMRLTGGRMFSVSTYYTVLDAMELKIHYTTEVYAGGNGVSFGYVAADEANEDILEYKKDYQHKVYNKGLFLGEYSDVANDPEFKEQINTILTTMPITLGHQINATNNNPESLTDEADDGLIFQDGESMQILYEGGIGLGFGSDVDVNYDMIITSYYGGDDWLITQDGEQLITQDYDPLVVTEGAPDGVDLFTGFLSQWKTNYGGDQVIETNLISYGWELNQVILETAGTTELDTGIGGNDIQYFGRSGSSNFAKLRQTFVAPTTGKMSQIRVKEVEFPYISSKAQETAKITLQLYAGTAHTGTVLATASAYITSNAKNDFYTAEELTFRFASYVNVSAATTYSIVLSSSLTSINTTGNRNIYVSIAAAPYASGVLSTVNGSGTAATVAAGDMAFAIDYAAGETSVNFTAKDPSFIMRTVLDFAISKGCHINYDADSILDTGTVVTYTFNTNTIAEAIAKVLELAPDGWYYYINPGNNTLYFKPRPSGADHIFTLGENIGDFEIEKNMENIVNEVYFSGAGTPALFKKTVDQDSQDEYRRGLSKVSDQRVSDSTTATILSQSEIDRNKDPYYTVTLSIPATLYDITTIHPGDLAMFRNFDNFIDDLLLQVVEKNYSRTEAKVVLGTLKPQVSKRVEDIKRNLDVLEQKNNPVSPS